jgi:predicted dienelactone hydrolase
MLGDAQSAGIDPQHVVVTEPVRGSDIPVQLTYVEMIDGVYAPIGLRTPPGRGPFPLMLFAAGNGGGGMSVVRDFTQNVSWTQEEFLKAGYAVAWMRYRAEIDYAYDKIGKLVEDKRQRRQLLNRGPLEYEDVIAIVKYVKTLPFIASDRVGYMGMSHGGEMAFKIASEYHGVRAMVACEPAAHEFLRLRPDATARINPETGLLDVERMLSVSRRRCGPASPRTWREPACSRSPRRSSCKGATPTSCRASSGSATTCSWNWARRRAGRPTSTTCTALSMCGGTRPASTRPMPCSGRRSWIRSGFLTST